MIHHQVMQRRLMMKMLLVSKTDKKCTRLMTKLSSLIMFLISRKASAWNQLTKFFQLENQNKTNQKIKRQVKTRIMTQNKTLRLIRNQINLTGVRLLRNSFWNWSNSRKAKSKSFSYFKARNLVNLMIPIKLRALKKKSNTDFKLNYRKIFIWKA